MSTRALVGHYTDDGAWRAVWVHWAPEELGARLVRAVKLHGGDPRPVLDHVFSTKGWSSWPDDPHHPADPDDVLFTPENVNDDFHWLYLFAVQARRLDVVPLQEDEGSGPEQQVHFDDRGKPDVSLGESDLTLADLKPVVDAWQRPCPEPLASALDALLDDLKVGEGNVGLGVDPAGNPVGRQLRVGARIVQLDASGQEEREELCHGGTALPLPEPNSWFEARPALWRSLCDALGMRLELAGDDLARFRSVVERVADPRFEIALAEAKEIDDGFEVGDDVGVIVGPAHGLWRWLFDYAWAAT